MTDNFKQKLFKLFEKVDDKILQAKIKNTLESLKSNDSKELAKKLESLDYQDILQKLNDMDMNRFKNISIDKQEIQRILSSPEIQKVISQSGEESKQVIEKLKSIL